MHNDRCSKIQHVHHKLPAVKIIKSSIKLLQFITVIIIIIIFLLHAFNVEMYGKIRTIVILLFSSDKSITVFDFVKNRLTKLESRFSLDTLANAGGVSEVEFFQIRPLTVFPAFAPVRINRRILYSSGATGIFILERRSIL